MVGPMSRGTLAARFPGVARMSYRTKSEQPLEALLAQMDCASADRARVAIGWILPAGAPLAQLGQVVLQEFVWHELPLKWMVESNELHKTVWALADLFAVAGLERYEELCRSSRTHLLLDAWQEEDRACARKAMKSAIRSSGVNPPDTILMGWGSVLGVAEQSATRRVSQVLEQAIDAGHLVPGGRGWKRCAIRITEAVLMLPRLELRGGTLFQAVSRERSQIWAAENPVVRQDLLAQMLPLLAREVAVPDEAKACLKPLRWLLEHLSDGVTLTRAGWLPKTLAIQANDVFGWFDLFGLTAQSEVDLPELAALNELARRARLTATKGRKLSLTSSGRRALANSPMLWRIVVADIFSAGTYEGEGAALAAAVLVQANRSVPYPTVETRVGAGLAGRWRIESGEVLEQWSSLDATREFGLLAMVFSWVELGDDGKNMTWMLTSPGRQAALMGLQLQARAPRHHL
jgi:hypothetical protein